MLLNIRITLTKCNFLLNESTVRCKHNLSRTIKKRRELNPGINLQAKLLNKEKELELEEVDFEELEADFANINLSHRQHAQELELLKERKKYLIIKQKYFKEKTPNFLTWSDKLQIRHLHSTDPELWTVEKLSEGFPALPETIEKILKGNWIKKSSRIKNHDTTVASNWNSFKKGQMVDLSPHLVEHLNKFTDRELNVITSDIYEDEKSSLSNNIVQGEFSEIITSYEHVKEKNNSLNKIASVNSGNEERKPQRKIYEDNTEAIESPTNFKYTKHITLNHLQKVLEGNADNDIHNQFLLQKLQEKQKNLMEKPENPIVEIHVTDDSEKDHLSERRQDRKNYNHLMYPQRITIPKNKFKSGYTYKLNDCYYDSNGLFLYRVPGMDK